VFVDDLAGELNLVLKDVFVRNSFGYPIVLCYQELGLVCFVDAGYIVMAKDGALGCGGCSRLTRFCAVFSATARLLFGVWWFFGLWG